MGPYDVEGRDGTRVEVKATGRLQSWSTKRLSTPRWEFKSVATSKLWSEDLAGYVPVEPASRVHVWVFALQTATDPASYDRLDLDQWEFRVMPHRQLLATGNRSAGLAFFDRHGVSPVVYDRLAAAIAVAP